MRRNPNSPSRVLFLHSPSRRNPDELSQSKSIDFLALEEAPLDRMLTNVDEKGRLYGVSGGSGGYAETIFRHAARELFNVEINGPVEFKTLRNSDFREAVLEVDGKQVLKFALCY